MITPNIIIGINIIHQIPPPPTTPTTLVLVYSVVVSVMSVSVEIPDTVVHSVPTMLVHVDVVYSVAHLVVLVDV